jgi:hypothetical protein
MPFSTCALTGGGFRSVARFLAGEMTATGSFFVVGLFRQKKSGCVVYTPGNPAEPERIEFSAKWDFLFAVHPRIYYLVLNLFLFIFM